MTFNEWVQKHNIPPAAVAELLTLSTYAPSDETTTAYSEENVKARVRLEAAIRGDVILWRNNVGAGKLANGSFIRWGLANDSAQLNKIIKSADLVGIKKRLITLADVGQYIGQFISRETKNALWKYTGNEHDQAQMQWVNTINAWGGDAKIVTDTGSL